MRNILFSTLIACTSLYAQASKPVPTPSSQSPNGKSCRVSSTTELLQFGGEVYSCQGTMGTTGAYALLPGGSSGGATTPPTTLLYKGTGVMNGVTPATPNTDYLPPANPALTGTATYNGVAFGSLATQNNPTSGQITTGLGYTAQNAATANSNNAGIGACSTHFFITGTAAGGTQPCAQPNYTDLAGTNPAAAGAALGSSALQPPSSGSGLAFVNSASQTTGVATGSQIVTAIGSTAVANATNATNSTNAAGTGGVSFGNLATQNVPAAGPTISTGSALANGAGSVQVTSGVTIQRDFPSALDPAYACTGSGDNSACLTAIAASTTDVNLPCGSTFQFSTPIVLTNPITVYSNGCSLLPVIQWNGTGNAITTNYNGAAHFNAGFRNVVFRGPSTSAGTTAFNLQGTGSNASDGFYLEHVEVKNFGLGVTWGSNAWATHILHSTFHNNGQNFLYPNSLTNSGEVVDIDASTFASDSDTTAGCVTIAGPAKINISGGAFDNCNVTLSSGASDVTLIGNHFEYPSGNFLMPFVINNASSGASALVIQDPNISVSSAEVVTSASYFSGSQSGSTTILGAYLTNGNAATLPLLALSSSANGYVYRTKRVDNVSTLILNGGTGSAHAESWPYQGTHVLSPYVEPDSSSTEAVVTVTNPTSFPTNMLVSSNSFSDAIWSAYNTKPTLTANSTDTADPMGGANAWKVVSSGANSGFRQTTNPRIIAGQSYTVSLWARTLTGTVSAALGTDDTASGITINSSWQRFQVTQTVATGHGFEFYVATTAQTVYIWGAQTVPGTATGTYVPTTTTPVILQGLQTNFVSSSGPVMAPAFIGLVNAVASSATPTFNLALGTYQTNTLTANVTSSTATGLSAGTQSYFRLTENSTGGFSYVWPTNIKGVGPINTAANSVNVVGTSCFDTSNCYATGPVMDQNGNGYFAGNVFANGQQSAIGFSSAAVTLTPGTNITSVTCTSTTCDVNGGSLSVVGGALASTGTFATVSYTAIATAPRVCTVSMNGGATFLGLGHGTPSTTSFTLTSAISVAATTFTMDYTCKP